MTLTGVAAAGAAIGLGVDAAAQTVRLTKAVDTTGGRVRGKQVGPIATFLGVPYGADTRLRRFQPPLPAAGSAGVRDCVALGHQALQSEIGGGRADLGSDFIKAVMAAGKQGMEVGNESENCLVLNLYTPDPSPARKRPVMVWLHGGGFAMGSAGDPQYDGSALARRGDVVVVGVNHRLNALGYLYLGELDPMFADSGNAGQLDIVLALQWVRDNIAQFGGDPDNVTIFGESGGGAKVSVMLAMPAAKGLFHKAVIQSGPGLTMVDKDSAAKHAERTLDKLGVAPADVRKLLEIDARTIVTAATAALAGSNGRALSPVVDGRSLPRDPFSPDAPPTARDVPLMIGTTKDESTLFLSPDPLFGKMTEEQARQKAVAMMGPKGAEGIDMFKRLRPNDPPTYWLTSLATASGTWINSIKLAERKLAQPAPVYMYRFDWETPFYNGALKAPHGTEVPFVFDNPQTRPILLGSGPVQQKLGAELSQAWIDFARSGDPSQQGLVWPEYDLKSRKTMIFDRVSHVVSDPDAAARELLSA